MGNAQSFRLQKEEQRFSAQGASGIIMIPQQGSEPDAGSQGVLTRVINDLRMTRDVFHGIMVMVMMGNEHGIRIHGAQRITAGVIVGIRHDTHAAFQRKQKLGMTDMLNEHGRSSFPEFYDAGLQPKKERERGGRDSPRRRHSAKD